MSNLDIDLDVSLSPTHCIYWGPTASSVVVLGFSAIVFGYNVHESSGSATCIVKILDGVDTSGMPISVVQLAQATSTSPTLDTRGVWCKNGVVVNVTSGHAEGTIYYRHYRPG